jgi:hypothetical protein
MWARGNDDCAKRRKRPISSVEKDFAREHIQVDISDVLMMLARVYYYAVNVTIS